MAGINHSPEAGLAIHNRIVLEHLQRRLDAGEISEEQFNTAKSNIEAGRPYKDEESGRLLDAEGKLPPPPEGGRIDPNLDREGNPLPGKGEDGEGEGGGEGEGEGEGGGRVDEEVPNFENPDKPRPKEGPQSALFPRMQLDINDGKPHPNFDQKDPAGVRGIRRDPAPGNEMVPGNMAFKERGVSFDNPIQVNDGVLSRVDIPDQQAVPPVPKAPDALPDDATDEQKKDHAEATKKHAQDLANRDEIIRQNTEALKMRNEAAANFANSARVRGSLASSGSHKVDTTGPDGQPRERGMTKGEQATHNATLRDQARQANNNRIMMNKLKDFRNNSNLQRGVSNWVDQSIKNGDLDPQTLGGKNFNEIMRNNPDEAMRLVQDFKDRSAQDAIRRDGLMRPQQYTEAQVQKAIADAGFQNVNGQMVNPEQADHVQRRMGLPGDRLDSGAFAIQQRNPHGVLTDFNGNPMPAHLETKLTRDIKQGPEALNPFSPIETPLLTQGINEGKITRGNPAAVTKIGPDGRPYLEPSMNQPFMPGPNYVHNPSWPSADNRRFNPAQLMDQGRPPLGSSNWDRPKIPVQENSSVQMPVPPAVKAAHDRVRAVEGKIDDLSAPAPQTQIPGASTGADPRTHPHSGPPKFNNPVPQGGIPGLGSPQNSPQSSPQDTPSPKPKVASSTLQFGQPLPGKRLSQEEVDELRRKQEGIFG